MPRTIGQGNLRTVTTIQRAKPTVTSQSGRLCDIAIFPKQVRRKFGFLARAFLNYEKVSLQNQVAVGVGVVVDRQR